jgi:hypothetical protein
LKDERGRENKEGRETENRERQAGRQAERMGSTCLTAVTNRFATAKENFTPCDDARGSHCTQASHACV